MCIVMDNRCELYDEINSVMCLSGDFKGPVIHSDAVQRTTKDARHKLIVNNKIVSRIKVENAPKWHGIYGIREVTEEDGIDIWMQRAPIDQFIIVHPKSLISSMEQRTSFTKTKKFLPLFSNTSCRKTCQSL